MSKRQKTDPTGDAVVRRNEPTSSGMEVVLIEPEKEKKKPIGTHQGRIHRKDQRERIQAKKARNRSRVPTTLSNGFAHHKPCREYPGCNHKKHGYRKHRGRAA